MPNSANIIDMLTGCVNAAIMRLQSQTIQTNLLVHFISFILQLFPYLLCEILKVQRDRDRDDQATREQQDQHRGVDADVHHVRSPPRWPGR